MQRSGFQAKTVLSHFAASAPGPAESQGTLASEIYEEARNTERQ